MSEQQKKEKDLSAELAAAPAIPDVAESVPASGLPNCVVLARAWMEAYVRAQETFDTRELDEFGYDAADLLGQVVLEYEMLAAIKRATEVSSSTAASSAPK